MINDGLRHSPLADSLCVCKHLKFWRKKFLPDCLNARRKIGVALSITPNQLRFLICFSFPAETKRNILFLCAFFVYVRCTLWMSMMKGRSKHENRVPKRECSVGKIVGIFACLNEKRLSKTIRNDQIEKKRLMQHGLCVYVRTWIRKWQHKTTTYFSIALLHANNQQLKGQWDTAKHTHFGAHWFTAGDSVVTRLTFQWNYGHHNDTRLFICEWRKEVARAGPELVFPKEL